MGVLPLQFPGGVDRKTLKLSGDERISLKGLSEVTAGMQVVMTVDYPNGEQESCTLDCRLDTALEVAYYNSGGIMPFVVNRIAGGGS